LNTIKLFAAIPAGSPHRLRKTKTQKNFLLTTDYNPTIYIIINPLSPESDDYLMKQGLTIIVFCLILFVGCSSRNFTNTPRTAVEQLLLSTAVDKAVEKINMPQIKDRTVYVDFSNLKAYDAEYIKTSICSRFAGIGATVVESPEDADYVAKISCGALGTEYKSTLFGIPAIPVPGSPTPLPELAIAHSIEQTGIVKLLVFVHSNGKAISSAHYYGRAERDESFFLFFRSQKKDDIRKAWEKSDAKLTTSPTH